MRTRRCSAGDQESDSSFGPWLGYGYQRLRRVRKLSVRLGIITRQLTFEDTKDVHNSVRQSSARVPEGFPYSVRFEVRILVYGRTG